MVDKDVMLETRWVITLTSGHEMSVFADTTRVAGEDRLFEVTVGEDFRLVVIARVPTALIRRVQEIFMNGEPKEIEP